ncbi:DUF972 family protein [Lactobacillus sp. S2-2]|uniref:DNA replication initiation control protein YabA n=1 Tax=Lactobacillus sp. S2-2 TaxID=2692917 RepID=UPI001F909660|nr:DNA replication initiation control protein YabA [Lactobacillus sp. S2-2]MCF6515664.1 DUF972 family protein [Lactobacillus sp. S2-2]
MKKKDLIDELNDLESKFSLMNDRLTTVKDTISELLEENSELKIENDHLRELLPKNQIKNDDYELSFSKKNLEKLYTEGFHVCNQFYGKRRQNDESCMFCTDIIYGER